MARTPAQTKAMIAKALKAGSKSEGMRELLTAGLSVSEVAEAFDAQYGFVYGVAKRAGLVTPTPRTAKAAPAAKAKAAATRPARPAAKAAAKGKTAAPTRSPEAIRAAARRAKAKAAKA